MAGTLILPVPDVMTAAYLVPASLDADDARRLITSALPSHVEDPLAEIAARMLGEGPAVVRDIPAAQVPPVPAELQRYLGVDPAAVRAVASAPSHALVTASWLPSWPPMHDWVARACAATLAAEQGSVLVDTFVPQILSADRALTTLPTSASAGIRLASWVLVFQSTSSTGTWLTTKGLGRFGLPELQVTNVPPQYGELWSSLMCGIASRLLAQWTEVIPARGEVAFAEIPDLLEVTEADVARAYRAPAQGGGIAQVRLRLDPACDDNSDSFLTIHPPEDFGASAGEYYAGMCSAVFGEAEQETRYVTSGHSAMAAAMETARGQLPAVRLRFLAGDIPLRARLMVKHRLDAADGSGSSEYPWAYVTSWDDAASVLGNCAADAVLDPRVRAGRPIVIRTEDVVDWAIWIDGEGVVEGGLTNVVAAQEGLADPPSSP